MLIVQIWYDGVREDDTGNWEDVLSFLSLVRPGEGVTAMRVMTLSGETVLETGRIE